MFVGYTLSRISFIDISAANATSDSNVSFSIKSNSNISGSIKAGQTIHKMVKAGNYEVTLSQNETSYISTVSVSGFFSSTTVSGKLVPEKARTFIGDNPGPCVQLISNVLISYSCSGTLDEVVIHVPATATQPTYTLKNPSSGSYLDRDLDGFVQTNEGAFVLAKSGYNNPVHTMYGMNSELLITSQTPLPDLDSNTIYSVKPLDKGFSVFNSPVTQIYTYSSVHAKPQIVKIPESTNKTLKLSSFDLSSNKGVFDYSYDNEDNKNTSSQQSKSQLVITKESINYYISSDKNYTSAIFCGSHSICTADSNSMDSYDISDIEHPIKTATLHDVLDIKSSDSGVLAIEKDGVINFNPETNIGSVEFSTGNLAYNGLAKDQTGYILSLSGLNNKRFALLVNQTSPNIDSIDKKVYELQKVSEISSISVYRQYVYISPNYGDPVFNNQTGYFDIDPKLKNTVKNKIAAALIDGGIDTSKYKIIFTN